MNEYRGDLVQFDLSVFEDKVLRTSEVLGALYFGSLGRGSADRFSDLDVMIWMKDIQQDETAALCSSILDTFGEVQFAITRKPMSVRAFVSPSWRRVELDAVRTSKLAASAKYRNAYIVKDTNGTLAGLVAESPPEVVEPSWYHVRCGIEEAIDSQIFLALHNARGASWSAMGEVSFRLSELHTLLSRLRGYRSFGFRYVEARLSRHEQELLATAWPREADLTEIRRSARALWEFSRHVWTEGETVLGQSLEISIDEPAFLAAIDRIYTVEPTRE